MPNKKDHLQLYFVAVVPEEPLRSEITELKQWIYDSFGSKAALRSPPHITLHMPFKWNPEKETFLIDSLANMAVKVQPFEVALHNFSCFIPRVIYVDVDLNDNLDHLKKNVMKLSRQGWKLDLPKDTRGFNPHITIGFRDLKKVDFFKAWEELKDKPFETIFKVNSLTLLRHNGRSWDELRNFSFKG